MSAQKMDCSGNVDMNNLQDLKEGRSVDESSSESVLKSESSTAAEARQVAINREEYKTKLADSKQLVDTGGRDVTITNNQKNSIRLRRKLPTCGKSGGGNNSSDKSSCSNRGKMNSFDLKRKAAAVDHSAGNQGELSRTKKSNTSSGGFSSSSSNNSTVSNSMKTNSARRRMKLPINNTSNKNEKNGEKNIKGNDNKTFSGNSSSSDNNTEMASSLLRRRKLPTNNKNGKGSSSDSSRNQRQLSSSASKKGSSGFDDESNCKNQKSSRNSRKLLKRKLPTKSNNNIEQKDGVCAMNEKGKPLKNSQDKTGEANNRNHDLQHTNKASSDTLDDSNASGVDEIDTKQDTRHDSDKNIESRFANASNGNEKKGSKLGNSEGTPKSVSQSRKSKYKRHPQSTKDCQDEETIKNNTTREGSDEAKAMSIPVTAVDKKKEKPKKKNKTTRETSADNEFDMSWICAECKEAECVIDPTVDQFLICEGPCRRIFHYPCAGLVQLPPNDEKWICNDCVNQRHSCAICQQYGKDDEDVFNCSRESCGNFFHESCLTMQNIEVTIVQATPKSTPSNDTVNNNKETDSHNPSPAAPEEGTMSDIIENQCKEFVGKRRFTCPAHWCWTCTQEMPNAEVENNDKEESNAKKKGTRKKKRRKKSSSQQSIFVPKKETRLYQCLECPISFHASCIPPLARFHELALLCHEHSATSKLPELDFENSLQGSYEANCDKRLRVMLEAQERKEKKNINIKPGFYGKMNNPFLRGMIGDEITEGESMLLDKLNVNNDYRMTFCLPCDLKDEVHSKPPSYKHIYSLKYDPCHRPKRQPPTEESCNCTGGCGEECMNRVLMSECFGDASVGGNKSKNSYSNCKLGPKCGNRMLGQRKSVKCKPQREQGKGWGLIAVQGAKKGDLVQEYMGEVIHESIKEKRLNEWSKEHPNDPNFYIMALSNGWYIDARHEANLSRFINHSCDPNCSLLQINVGGFMRNGIYAKRDISPGEFLSYDYHFDTRHGDKFTCRCGAANCRGTMKNIQTTNPTEKKKKKEVWEAAKAKYERDKKFVKELLDRKSLSFVASTVPGSSNSDETVANGPQNRYRATATHQRLFLWRNAIRGSDFTNRGISVPATSSVCEPSVPITENKNENDCSLLEKANAASSQAKKKIDMISMIMTKNKNM